jgi:hypothetical protein
MFNKLKYKVGDLVTISYERGRIGIVTEIRENHTFPYIVKWLIETTNIRSPRLCDIGHYSVGVIISLEEVCNIK